MCQYVGEYTEENLLMVQRMNKGVLEDLDFVQPGKGEGRGGSWERHSRYDVSRLTQLHFLTNNNSSSCALVAPRGSIYRDVQYHIHIIAHSIPSHPKHMRRWVVFLCHLLW